MHSLTMIFFQGDGFCWWHEFRSLGCSHFFLGWNLPMATNFANCLCGVMGFETIWISALQVIACFVCFTQKFSEVRGPEISIVHKASL